MPWRSVEGSVVCRGRCRGRFCRRWCHGMPRHVAKKDNNVHTGVPGGLVGGPRACQDQFREFESHRVHAHRDFFLHKKLISGKRESVSWLHSMKIDEQWEC